MDGGGGGVWKVYNKGYKLIYYYIKLINFYLNILLYRNTSYQSSTDTSWHIFNLFNLDKLKFSSITT